MSLPLAVLNDHHSAQVLQFDADRVQRKKVRAHAHHTGHDGSNVRAEHEFFGGICDVLAGFSCALSDHVLRAFYTAPNTTSVEREAQ